MNATKGSKPGRRALNQRIKMRVEKVLEKEQVTLSELLWWQTDQLYAALRERLLKVDPQAVEMIDALVRDFYTKNWLEHDPYNELDYDGLIRTLDSAQRLIRPALPEEQVRAIIQQKVGPYRHA